MVFPLLGFDRLVWCKALSFLFPPLCVCSFFFADDWLESHKVIGLLPLFLYLWALLIKFLHCMHLCFHSLLFFPSSISSYLSNSLSLSFLLPFLTFQLAHTSFSISLVPTFLHASHSLRVSTPLRIASPINTFPFSPYSHILLFFYFFLFPFTPAHVLFLFFFLVEIMHMHIPYYLHLCSNYDKARCSHTFLPDTKALSSL